MLQLCNDRLSVCLLPSAGGAIARFDWLGQGRRELPLMRPCDGSPEVSPGRYEPNRLACYPLLPWSNRIAHGGFFHGGRRIALALNRKDDPYPIHGSGWQRAWSVREHEADVAVLVVDEIAPEAHSYRASLEYRLERDTLRVALRVTNTGSFALPFGLGLHPFFPLHGGVRLRAAATSVWLNDGYDPLPVRRAPVPTEWDFSSDRELPSGGLNHAFVGWRGQATIEWPALALRLHVEADTDGYILYVPEGEDFFCMEPVDHPINAVHLPGGPIANGMTDLAPGETLERAFAFRAEASDSRKEERSHS
ncbi:aldose 1-epimerase [Luteibacter sp. RCC_6_2]